MIMTIFLKMAPMAAAPIKANKAIFVGLSL
jgi:hypothetical protein